MNDSLSSQSSWKERTGTNARAIEEHLAALRDANRLRVHRWEDFDKTTTFPMVRNDLEAGARFFEQAAEGKTHTLSNAVLPVISMSLVPNSRSQKTVRVYDHDKYGFNLTYLFDMQTPNPTPPRVIRAFQALAQTNRGNTLKDFKLWSGSGIEGLDRVYDGICNYDEWLGLERHKIDKRQSEYLTHMFNHPELTGRQLDALATRFDKSPEPAFIYYDEVLVAASPKHVAAIALPVGKHDHPWGLDPAFWALNAQLAGALSGLDHARQKAPLPVVLYDMDPLHKGRISYLAQGEEECRVAALNAVRELQDSKYASNNRFDLIPEYMPWVQHANRLLGVNMLVPLKEQGIVLPVGGRGL